jgi:hypothetical protein
MKKILAALLFMTASLLVAAQDNLLNEFLTASGSANTDVSKFVNHTRVLAEKRSTNDVAFLQKIFRKTQKTFLKSYSPYISFDQTFKTGKYDCLTATALYSILLQEFHFDFSVVETNYHIFIVVHTNSGDVLLETTDRYQGFVQDKKEIEKRIGAYKQNLITSNNSNAHYYDFSFRLYKKISPAQLTGLLYFNQAVNAFNSKQWKLCSEQLGLSASKYNSPRIKELAALLVQSVMQSNANEEVKQAILQKFKSVWLEGQPIASNN